MQRPYLVHACLLLAAAATLTAQAPLLHISPPQQAPHGLQVVVTNQYSAPATAYAIEIFADGGQRPLAGHVEDSVPGPVVDRISIAPGESRVLRFGRSAWQDAIYKDDAVIYADGATAGDAAMIAHLLRARRQTAVDLTDTLLRIAAAQNDPTANAPALIQMFQARATAHTAALRDGMPPTLADRVCNSAVMSLQQQEGIHQSLAQTLDGLHHMFTRWLQQLQASKPSLSQ